MKNRRLKAVWAQKRKNAVTIHSSYPNSLRVRRSKSKEIGVLEEKTETDRLADKVR
jgi:hypothetical protein